MLNRTKAPPIKDALDFNFVLKPFEKFTLDNGVEVFAVDAGAEAVLQVEWIFDAGNWFEDQNLVASATNYLLKNGTTEKNAFEINEYFEYYGAFLNRSAQHERAGLSLHCLSRYASELMPVVAELIRTSVFPDPELQLYRQNNKQRLEVSLKKSEFVAGRLIDEYLFGFDHPYGRYSSAADYDALTRDQLLSFYKQHYQSASFRIFIAGKLPAGTADLLNRYFGQFPVQPNSNFPAHAIVPAREKKYRVVNDADGVQGSIRMARSFPNRHHPDYTGASVLNNIFGGFFGSRLMTNIREDKGYTYGIHSYLQGHLQEAAWMISTEAGRDVCEATIAEVYKEMERLREVPVSADELLLVKNYILGTVLGDLDGPFHIIGKWKNIILNNLPLTHFDEHIEETKSLTAAQLQELANRYLVPGDFYELVVI